MKKGNENIKILAFLIILFLLSFLMLIKLAAIFNQKNLKTTKITSKFFSTKTESYLNQPQLELNNSNSNQSSTNCQIRKISEIVRGNSMSGILENGQEITVLEGYYKCHEVQRNDIVVYNYAGGNNHLVKIVKAIPKDSWYLKMTDSGYEIIVNQKPLKTSSGEVYKIPPSNVSMLKLYTNNYPTIPENTYLLMGNLPYGTLDSTRFGLVNKADIIGKVEK
jgi:signal peptidase I